ncbi:MAG: WYL domain-containing protein [Bacteroidetes bacterium]|nr:MAG: WYL domain-containing protein [Bacteroidota bacterium]
MPHIKNALIRYRVIDRCLRNKFRPFPSKKELREACEEELYGSVEGANICDSTIEKDMFQMKMEHDAPIRYSKRHGGYYYEDPDFTISDIPLTDDDLEALSFAVKTLQQFKESNVFKQFGSAIDKISDRVAVSKTEDSESFIQFEQSSSEGGSEFITDLLGAIKSSNLVEFDYGKFDSEELDHRKVLPLLLKQYRNRWYLISFDVIKNEYRTFALDRFDSLDICDERASRPKDFNPDNFFKHSIGITSGKESPQMIRFKASELASKYIDSLPLHGSQKIDKMLDDGYVFSLYVIITEELIREFMSYGGAVQILEPITLKNEIRSRAERILKNH